MMSRLTLKDLLLKKNIGNRDRDRERDKRQRQRQNLRNLKNLHLNKIYKQNLVKMIRFQG